MKRLQKFFLLTGIAWLLAFQASAIVPDFTFTTGCLGTPTILTSTTTPSDSVLALLWDLDMDGLFDDGVGKTVIWTFNAVGNNPVGLQVVALNGNIEAIYKNVPVSGVQASFSFSAGCMGQPILFTDLSTAFSDSILLRTWNFGDGSPSVETKNPQHTYTQEGTFIVSLIVASELGCPDTLRNEIVMQLPPVFSLIFTGDTAAFFNDTILVEVTGSYDSAVWNGTVSGDYFVVVKAGSYDVSVYRDGCFSSQTFIIRNHPTADAGIMTLFTPNGDGFNDFWVIKDMETLGTCSVRIFNSWGSQVYENADYQNTWDGRSNNAELPSGPYYYVVQFANGQVYKGTVNILR
ncbi:MAG: gliding motility-associated C-terminal domain-containing protein [Bacteroidales bacterium]|nr:gliding motility-associated C-terminal domain-containing protein [Bacteroidales bacterium]